MATVVVLNGTSSSGKSALARAFQERAPRLFLNFSIDSILDALPPGVIARIQTEETPALPISELVRAFYACVGELLALGHDLVIDHAVTARYHAEALLDAVELHDVLLVGLECPAAILVERERARGNRRKGLAAQQLPRIHAWLEYDLSLDTSALTPDEGALRIVEALENGRRGALERTRAKLSRSDSLG